jgi:predicted DNA-binding antitoxin AbrB/MazE fold protein
MMVPQILEAIYENGVLRPLKPLEGVIEHSRVKITVEPEETLPHPLLQFAGILSDAEAAELRQIVKNEFEEIEHNGW